uniref:DDE Tnp4 domain-containing protein n=1 Tax=Mycena chlorophos TaxID=658473 RepID=A0ABQ0LPC4_MYCCL|nr:predicted protein [Mycena chlorophos]
MPSAERRAAVTRRLLKSYLKWLRARRHLKQQRHRRLQRLRRAHPELVRLPILDTEDWEWDDGDLENNDTDSDGDDNEEEHAEDSLSDGMDDWDGDEEGGDESGQSVGGDESEDYEQGEPYDGDEDLSDLDNEVPGNHLRGVVLRHIDALYSRRYLAPRTRIQRISTKSLLHETLYLKKITRPDHFRERLRMSPLAFDWLVTALEADPIFWNESDAGQSSVEDQLAVTLYWFGHDGNAASMQSVADWAGIGKGTVGLWAKRVMTAVLRPEFLAQYVRYPTDEEKADAQDWVVKHSCPAFRGGWCFVDGTLVPLATRPFWYGESYFDRKSRYSLNIQIVSLPNLRIVDFSYGHTGSAHDATAWGGTRIAANHTEFLGEKEWIWADSAYPIRSWIVSPYKAPDRYLPDNDTFNKTVSKLRIRSEHAIGFLKGRFYSLKNLRIVIRDAKSHRFATYWVAACVSMHAFAMVAEADEKAEADSDDEDPFVEEVWIRKRVMVKKTRYGRVRRVDSVQVWSCSVGGRRKRV